MKRMNVLLIGMLISSQFLFAGGLVTNTNQSAAWARTLSRNAALGVDAVYFNPAGLAQFDNGLHLSLSNQSIFQTRTISSDFQFLNSSPSSYEAELTAPIFPSIYAAYKMDKWTFSGGFNIIGGGGSADFPTGLPSFEVPVSTVVPILQRALAGVDAATGGATSFSNVTGYSMNTGFTGTSTYMGFQLGATYAINDMISVAIGGRYVTVKNTYEGSLTDIMIISPDYGGAWAPGSYVDMVIGAIGGDPTGQLGPLAEALHASTADQNLSAVQKGSGFTPIIGLNVHLSDKINIAARYEHHTKIELTNETSSDTEPPMFPDGETSRADMPGMFALGVQVSPLKKLTASVGFDYFLDKPAYYGNTDGGEQINNETTIDENAYTFSASLEYKLLDILGVSAGFSTGNLGVNEDYQSDLSYALKSKTVAGGVFVDLGEKITLNAGLVYVMYDDYSKSQTWAPDALLAPLFPDAPISYSDTYGKNTMIVAVGVDISL